VTTLTANDAQAVVPRARSQSTSDFDDLYGAAYQRLTLQLYAYLGDLAEAQDVVQEAFCRAYAGWRKVSRHDDPLAWVRRTAWKLATTKRRRPQPTGQESELVQALATIPPQQRRAVVLHYMARLSVAEIAEQESVAESTVTQWLSRGRAALAGRLAEGTANDGFTDVQKGN
jgi:RNA polymerase sigma-70 factor (ECF subfamily)